ncbi:MAG TPA: KUP/HAK/KT family potassium transporter, partial [Steroidobacteraceae bacterium]|nr:KUP/HAK/KT family potassium transporter [Steroidobacteraceae bacterium]
MGLPASAAPAPGHVGAPSPHRPALFALSLAALGVVYGDIGTSPLYTLKTVFDPANGLPLDAGNVIG